MLQRCTLAIGFLALLLVPVSSLLVRLRRPSAAFGAAAGARLLQQQQRHRHRLAMSSSSGGGGGGGAAGAVLLLGTTEDKASVGMVNALVRRGGWESMEIPEGRAWRRIDAPQLFLWQITRGFLRADNLDRQWMQATGTQKLQDILYLSRHAAASGKPSLTIHPIGNPGQPLPPDGADSAARAEHGGIPGKIVPASPRIAPLFRQLYDGVKASSLSEEFEVTLEATHHGPWHGAGTPCCFVEIGSKEEDWGREDAAEVWAEVLEKSLLGSSGCTEPPPQSTPKCMVVSVGGGHYQPKACDLLRHRDDVLVGHMLANYCFTGKKPEDWQAGVFEAVAASKAAAAGDVPVVLFVDKKSFKSELRNELVAFLDAKGLPYAFKENELIEVAERVAAGSVAAASAASK